MTSTLNRSVVKRAHNFRKMTSWRIFFIIAIALCILGVVESDQPKVTTENGVVVGTYKTSYGGFIYKAFEGIPYAKPPVNDNRFKVCTLINDRTENVNTVRRKFNFCS